MTRDDLAAAMLHADRSGATDAEVTMRYAAAIATYVDARLGAASTPDQHIPVTPPPLGRIRRPVMDRLDPSGALRELVEKAAALAQAATLFQNDPGSMSRDADLLQAVEAITPLLAELDALEPEPADVPDVAQTDVAPVGVGTEQHQPATRRMRPCPACDGTGQINIAEEAERHGCVVCHTSFGILVKCECCPNWVCSCHVKDGEPFAQDCKQHHICPTCFANFDHPYQTREVRA